MADEKHHVFVTGGTGFLGRALVAALVARGHRVTALARRGSEGKLPPGTAAVYGDPLDSASFTSQVGAADTFVQLVGVSHPNPSKAAQFRAIDYTAGCAGADAAAACRVRHFVYVSVAHPAPVMKAYIAARSAVEEHILGRGLQATILRPWYVLGPGRRWPLLLKPFYALFSAIPATRDGARRLGLVTDLQMTAALVSAVEHPAEGIRIVEVPEIARASLS